MITSKVIYRGELQTEAEHIRSGSFISTDAPVDNQGKGSTFSPTDLLATALASCMLTVMGIKARDKGWDINGTTVEVIKEMASDPRRVSAVRLRMTFPEGNFAAEQKKLLEQTAIHCPVAKSLHPDIDQDITFVWP